MQVAPVQGLEHLRQLEGLQADSWGCNDREIVPSHLLLAAAHHHSCLLGGFHGDELIGFVYAFPAGDYLYSHMAAVAPEWRGRGYGIQLKQAEAQWARERGFRRIVWTFDPLQATNSRLNLHSLGATAQRYLVHYYGDLEDEINRGVPTDRVEVDWWLDGRPRPPRRESFSFPWPLDDQERREWRLELRHFLLEAFARGLVLMDFEVEGRRATHFLG